MANITPRKNKDGSTSYLIRVFVDQKLSGQQIMKSMTYKPEAGLTQRQIDKKLIEISMEFEKKCKFGLISFDGSTRFEEYAAKWLENAQIAPKTKEQYKYLLVRINQAIGHVKLQNVQAHHLEAFYKNLSESGINPKGRYAVAYKLDEIMTDKKLSRNQLAINAGISPATISTALRGKHIRVESANKIAKGLKMPAKKVFKFHEEATTLSSATIIHHHKVISAILGDAKKKRIIPFNVAVEHCNAPKLIKKEARYLDDEQARQLVELLLLEPDIRIKTSILLALYSGLRLGELCGLSWSDIDFDKNIIHVVRASQYLEGMGVVEVPTKNASSNRVIKLPPFIFDILAEYKKWWLEQKLMNGNRWNGHQERLFIQSDGLPIFPDTINYWLDKFIAKNNIERFTPHSLRHTFSTLQIMAGVNIRTLQQRTGHSKASTLTDLYAHAIASADEMAVQVLDNILTPKAK